MTRSADPGSSPLACATATRYSTGGCGVACAICFSAASVATTRSKNSANPTDFYRIPPGRVVEMGAQVTV